MAVRSMNHDLARINKEREIIAGRKHMAQRAYMVAERQRTDMLM